MSGPWLPEPLLTGPDASQPDHIALAEVGGGLSLVFHRQGSVYSVDTVQITDGLITAYRRVINPDRLLHLRAVTSAGSGSSP
jgi:RNA polymerase sigma-70 factor (ECF subfamily)